MAPNCLNLFLEPYHLEMVHVGLCLGHSSKQMAKLRCGALENALQKPLGRLLWLLLFRSCLAFSLRFLAHQEEGWCCRIRGAVRLLLLLLLLPLLLPMLLLLLLLLLLRRPEQGDVSPLHLLHDKPHRRHLCAKLGAVC